MKEKEIIEIPQRGRPKKNNMYTPTSYAKTFDTGQIYKPYENRIFENQYELDKCDIYDKPIMEAHSYDDTRLNDAQIHENMYEQNFDNIQDGYPYDRKMYEEPKQIMHRHQNDFNQNIHDKQSQSIYNQQRQLEYHKETQNRFLESKQSENIDPYYQDDELSYRNNSNANYEAINEFDDSQFYNMRKKESKNLYSYADHFMNPGWMQRKKRKNNPYLWQYIKKQENGHLCPPSEYSSLEYVKSLEKKGKKVYLGTLKRPSYTEKIQCNNTILPLFLNSSSSYESSTSRQEFDKIAKTFLSKIEFLDYENVTVQQLKILMKEFGLSHTGKKLELIDRMKQTASMIRDRMKGRIGSNIENKNPKKKEIYVKSAPGMDNEMQGFDYLFF